MQELELTNEQQKAFEAFLKSIGLEEPQHKAPAQGNGCIGECMPAGINNPFNTVLKTVASLFAGLEMAECTYSKEGVKAEFLFKERFTPGGSIRSLKVDLELVPPVEPQSTKKADPAE